MPPYPSVDFGMVGVNLPAPQNRADASFTITNNGTDPLWSFGYSIERSQFTLVNQTCAGYFYPGQTCTVTMRYTPQSTGEYWGAQMSVWFAGLVWQYPVQLFARSYLANVTVPGAPTAVAATAGYRSATVTFAAPASNGGIAISSYAATSAPGGIVASCTSPCSSIWVPSLTNGVAYTFTVRAVNTVGASVPSAPSSPPVTPSVTAPPGPCNSDCDCSLGHYCGVGNFCTVENFPGPFPPGQDISQWCYCDLQCAANQYCHATGNGQNGSIRGLCQSQPDISDRAADNTACGNMGVAHPSPSYLFRSTISGWPGAAVRKFNRHASCNGGWWEDTSLAGQTIGANGTLVIDYPHSNAFTCGESSPLMGQWESIVLVDNHWSPVRSFTYFNSPCGGSVASCSNASNYCPPSGACNGPGCH